MSSATPRNPIATPGDPASPTRIVGKEARGEDGDVKIGTVDWAIPAMLESMWVSPQATRSSGARR